MSRAPQSDAVWTRRGFIAAAAAGLGWPAVARENAPVADPPFGLGLITSGIAGDWTFEALLKRCESHGLKAVTFGLHDAHNVSLSLPHDARRQVLERLINKTSIKPFGLCTPCSFGGDDAEVQRQIESAAEYLQLLFQIEGVGIHVRSGDWRRLDSAKTERSAQQLIEALRQCGERAARFKREVWVDFNSAGPGAPMLRRIVEAVRNPSVGVNWISDLAQVERGSVRTAFELLKPHIRSVHLGELWTRYPYRELFKLLRDAGYSRFTMANLSASADADQVLRYYVRLWQALTMPD